MPSHFGSYILAHSKRLTNDVFKQIGAFYSNSNYHTDTDSLFIRKKNWSDLVDKEFSVNIIV